MLGDITLGQFFPGNSVVHRIDPRMKLLLTLVYIVAIFLIQGFLGYGVLLVFLVSATLLSRLKPSFLLKSIKPILFIVVFTFVLNLFFVRGDTVLFSWWIFKLTLESLLYAAFMSLRLVFLILGTSLLTFTTSPIALTDALERVLKPLKYIRFPVHEMSMMMTIALRFIPTLLEETDKDHEGPVRQRRGFLTPETCCNGPNPWCRCWCRCSSAPSAARTSWPWPWKPAATTAARAAPA